MVSNKVKKQTVARFVFHLSKVRQYHDEMFDIVTDHEKAEPAFVEAEIKIRIGSRKQKGKIVPTNVSLNLEELYDEYLNWNDSFWKEFTIEITRVYENILINLMKEK